MEKLVPVEIDSNETVETCDTLPLPRITSTPQVAKITKISVPLETPIAAPPPPMPRLEEEESTFFEKKPEGNRGLTHSDRPNGRFGGRFSSFHIF